MRSLYYYNKVLMGAMLTMLLLLVACASEDDQGAGQPLRLVNANLTISLPKRIANIHRITRMSSDIVQANSDENDFRGLSDIHMLCFNQYPTQTSSNLGNMISIKTSGDEVNDTVTHTDYRALSAGILIITVISQFFKTLKCHHITAPGLISRRHADQILPAGTSGTHFPWWQ